MTSEPTPLRRPRTLKPGDTVGLVALADGDAVLFPARTRRAIDNLTKMGFRVREGNLGALAPNGQAGPPRERADAFNALVADPSVAAIVSVIGGDSTVHTLPFIDFAALRASPKILLGYSDFSTLLLAVLARSGVAGFHGPALLPQFGEVGGLDPYTLRAFEDVLMRGECGLAPPPPFSLREILYWDRDDVRARAHAVAARPLVLRPGSAQGRLIVANIRSVEQLVGGPWLPSLEGAILGLEAAEEETAASFTGLLADLQSGGVLEGVAGLIIGAAPANASAEAFAVEIEAVLRVWERPLACEMPFGHLDPQYILPLGVRAHLDCGPKGPSLYTLEAGAMRAA